MNRDRQTDIARALSLVKIALGAAGTIITITFAAASVPAQTAISNLESYLKLFW